MFIKCKCGQIHTVDGRSKYVLEVIKYIMKHKEFTSREIVDATGIKRTTVATTVRRMIRSKVIKISGVVRLYNNTPTNLYERV